MSEARDLTPRAAQILERASERAGELGQELVGAEHLLLALCEEPESVARRALDELGVADALRERLLEILREPGYNTPTRLIADSEGRVLGEVKTDDQGIDVFVDLEGKPSAWPTPD